MVPALLALVAVAATTVPAAQAQAEAATTPTTVSTSAASTAIPVDAVPLADGPRSAVRMQEPAEEELVQRYAPVVRVREQLEPCGNGEPYPPTDVDVLMDNDGVALRGPWTTNDLVEIAPSADDLGAGLLDYHLDFPGDPLNPGCGYEQWGRAISRGTVPTVYGRVVEDAARPEQTAVQYWFFYVFNDFNNLHEGDWEMIQLVFDAPDAEAALDVDPTSIGYSQHSGAERAGWGDDKLEIVDGTHPVVYPAEGSHANFFTPALYLGASSATGVGCDDTTGPHTQLRTRTDVIPTDDYVSEYPWLGFQGHWGERQESFYNGPTGPNMKSQWTAPIRWSETSWRDTSATVPLGASLGPSATDAFCGVVATGSNLLRQLVRNPPAVLLGLAVLVAAIAAVASRTRWGPGDPYPVMQRRSWGRIIVAARRMYARHPLLFIGIGLVYIPVMLIAAGLQWVLVEAGELTSLVDTDGDQNAATVFIVVLMGGAISLLAYFCVVAATAEALRDLDAGERVTVLSAYRAVRAKLRPLALVAARLVVIVWALLLFVVTAPLALIYAVRNGFAVQAVMMEDHRAGTAFHRSREVVRGQWWRATAVGALVVGLGAITGPLVGIVLLLVSDGSFNVINVITALVYVVTIPFVALVLGYLYVDLSLRAGSPEAGEDRPDVPAGALP
ncbi:Vps62-related protein [Jiangella endophytica]|uniref:Vps62-related protein n=1 Tax=Jiangella endophytica TaxID=1623398 RepID=UPI000E3432F7|nr:Vps62-related protein [Jiangella endophytica]